MSRIRNIMYKTSCSEDKSGLICRGEHTGTHLAMKRALKVMWNQIFLKILEFGESQVPSFFLGKLLEGKMPRIWRKSSGKYLKAICTQNNLNPWEIFPEFYLMVSVFLRTRYITMLDSRIPMRLTFWMAHLFKSPAL